MNTDTSMISEINDINELITLTYKAYEDNSGTIKYADCLLKILKEYHYWPNIKIKKSKSDPNIVLIHNSYFKSNTEKYKKLYEQCRSVVLDFSKSIGNNVVITYSLSTPERVNIQNYTTTLYSPDDICKMALDGTMITFYYHNNSWWCGTTSCPDINSSKFSHPTKTHGMMLNEILYDYFKSVIPEGETEEETILKIRTLFTNCLNPLYSYDFILVHHENKHIIDYSNELGIGYKKLYHINTKNRVSLTEESLDDKPLTYLGVEYIDRFINPETAINYLINNNNCYGIIVKKENKLLKIASDEILKREEMDPCYHNKWYNILYIFMLNRHEYNINDYIRTYLTPDFKMPTDAEGNIIDPTYLIYTVLHIIKDILYNLYIASTKYYNKYNRFKMDKKIDGEFNSVLRYHLAQLRYDQTTVFKGRIITPDNVYYYICNNKIQNIIKIIRLIASNNTYDIPPNKFKLFQILSELLKD